MSTMFIQPISFPSNDEYEPKFGSPFVSFSLVHGNGNIGYPPIFTWKYVPIRDLVTGQGIYTKCTRPMC